MAIRKRNPNELMLPSSDNKIIICLYGKLPIRRPQIRDLTEGTSEKGPQRRSCIRTVLHTAFVKPSLNLNHISPPIISVLDSGKEKEIQIADLSTLMQITTASNDLSRGFWKKSLNFRFINFYTNHNDIKLIYSGFFQVKMNFDMGNLILEVDSGKKFEFQIYQLLY